MEHIGVLLQVVVALGGALVLGLLAARIGQSPIVGYLLAGVLVGPGALSIVQQEAEVRLLAELGVALLLFTIGLEFSWSRLRSLGPVALVGGAAQIGVTAALGTLGAVALGAGTPGGIVIGMILALSSTAVVFRVLAERAEIDGVPGRVSVGILLMQDIAVIPAVLLVPLLAGAGEGGVLGQLAAVLLRGGLLIVGMIVVARYVLPTFFETAALKSRELFIILGLTFCLAATWAAAAWGLSPVLGAFVAGMLLADSRYANQIRSDIGPLRAGFVALFFVSIGMLAEPAWILGRAPVVAAAVAVIVVGKGLVTGLVVRSFRHTTATALVSGLTLAHIGELSFVLADLGRIHELIGAETFQLIVSASVVTLLLTPYLIAGSQRVRSLMVLGAGRPADAEPATAGSHTHRHRAGHVIVVGYGPTGARVVAALQEVGTPHLVIEMNPRTVESGPVAGPGDRVRGRDPRGDPAGGGDRERAGAGGHGPGSGDRARDRGDREVAVARPAGRRAGTLGQVRGAAGRGGRGRAGERGGDDGREAGGPDAAARGDRVGGRRADPSRGGLGAGNIEYRITNTEYRSGSATYTFRS